ncbi:MAG: TonB family protein [Hymenobacteraceae bacterium]|nr:TonB family protein [Hymenobacteraceae bacterium]
MRNLLLSLLTTALLTTSAVAYAQTPTQQPKLHSGTPERARPSQIGGRPDQPCRFPGPNGSLQKFLRENLKYPATAADKQISGQVTVQFMVQADGTLTDFSTVGDSLGAGCEAEALRVARLMPNWEPAKRRTQPVPTTTLLTLPFGATPVLDDPKHRHQK